MKSRGLKLKGAALKRHIAEIEKRIEITECLRDADPRTGEVVAIKAREIDLKVTTRCDGRTAVFELVNRGRKWPKPAGVALYRVADKKLLTRRRMRLANNQIATFRMGGRGKPVGGEVGLFIEPGWFEREFAYDAKILCDTRAKG